MLSKGLRASFLNMLIVFSSTLRADPFSEYLHLPEIAHKVSFWKKIFIHTPSNETLFINSKRFEFVTNEDEGPKVIINGQRENSFTLYERYQGFRQFLDHRFRVNDLDTRLTLITLLESGMNINAVSPKGAAGLWQLMSPTAKEMGLTINQMVDERFNPVLATNAAIKLLKFYQSKFKNWPLSITAYNFGFGNVQRHRLIHDETVFESIDSFNFESRNYFYKLMAFIESKDEFSAIDREALLDKEYIVRSLPFSLSYVLFKKFFRGRSDFKAMSNHLLSLVKQQAYNIPANTKLVIPKSLEKKLTALIKNYLANLKKMKLLPFYEVKRGDGLYRLAQKLKTPYKQLVSINNINSQNIHIGQKIYYAPIIHTVKEGETLLSLSERYKVSINKLLKLNLLPKGALKEGVLLDIPTEIFVKSPEIN